MTTIAMAGGGALTLARHSTFNVPPSTNEALDPSFERNVRTRGDSTSRPERIGAMRRLVRRRRRPTREDAGVIGGPGADQPTIQHREGIRTTCAARTLRRLARSDSRSARPTSSERRVPLLAGWIICGIWRGRPARCHRDPHPASPRLQDP